MRRLDYYVVRHYIRGLPRKQRRQAWQHYYALLGREFVMRFGWPSYVPW